MHQPDNFVVTGIMMTHDGHFFYQMITMRKLKLSFVSEHALRGLPELRAIRWISCGLKQLPEFYHVQSTLEILRIADDTLLSIPDDALMQFDQLKSASFPTNYLEFLPIISKVIIKLHVDQNKIERIIDIGVECGSRLRYLTLRNNRISFMSFMFLRKLPFLQALALQNNRLHTLPNLDAFVRQSALRLRLLVDGNPWVCNASMVWLSNTTLKHHHFSFKKFYIHAYFGMVCHAPPEMKGTILGQIGQKGKGLSLKEKCHKFVDIFTSCIGKCQMGNNSQPRHFHQNYISFLMFYDIVWRHHLLYWEIWKQLKVFVVQHRNVVEIHSQWRQSLLISSRQ